MLVTVLLVTDHHSGDRGASSGMAGQHVRATAASCRVLGFAPHLPDQVLPGNVLTVTPSRSVLSSADFNPGILPLAG